MELEFDYKFLLKMAMRYDLKEGEATSTIYTLVGQNIFFVKTKVSLNLFSNIRLEMANIEMLLIF